VFIVYINYLNCYALQAEKFITESKFDKEYLPIGGCPVFCKGVANLAFGDDNSIVSNGLVSYCFYVFRNLEISISF